MTRPITITDHETQSNILVDGRYAIDTSNTTVFRRGDYIYGQIFGVCYMVNYDNWVTRKIFTCVDCSIETYKYARRKTLEHFGLA